MLGSNHFQVHPRLRQIVRRRCLRRVNQLLTLFVSFHIFRFVRWLRKSGIPTGKFQWTVRFSLIVVLTLLLVPACSGGVPPQSVRSLANDCHVVKHAMGETCVPNNPQRVVVWAGTELDPVLALGVKPIAGHPDTLTYVKGKLSRTQWEGIEHIGESQGPNLEQLLVLKPDLILGHASRIQQVYNQLSQIAPTVLDGSDDWKETLMLFAEALGKTDTAKQLLNDYQLRIEEFKTRMGDHLPKTVAIIEIRPDTLIVYPDNIFAVTVMKEAGLSFPPTLAKYSGSNWNISKERLSDIDSDALFVVTWSGEEKGRREVQSFLEKLKADPLWLKLKVVQQDKVYEVGDYFQGAGPLTANLILDDLFKYLVEEEKG
ncbi:ABC transporter substrate-binding protein [Gloeocapsopsis dulcis]|uniref:Fe/B12 periplasmic-binding domain-containing protein n=1 Tax=Gloeocapsopsis dulcis AAB1 = 1H9 TaxID=1433147 RepID=A0A6N8FNU0_9CHRO|nr:iron-siderophore ABC transporter substrate-binding protein [Gloeocapsopsis dulcis]MUL35003.1 hypothetical protein [Gloeocapsopsis dulcis AAB1 = 1H9]WNN89922.1 iron-siderophore ABC transporter substrate-binding protein [Gloeocapsopsis dulcis]